MAAKKDWEIIRFLVSAAKTNNLMPSVTFMSLSILVSLMRIIALPSTHGTCFDAPSTILPHMLFKIANNIMLI
jgi:hypothetical protein